MEDLVENLLVVMSVMYIINPVVQSMFELNQALELEKCILLCQSMASSAGISPHRFEWNDQTNQRYLTK